MNQPNRNVSVHPESRSGSDIRRTFLTQEQYVILENKFPIDGRANHEFQLGVQAVLKALRDGIVTPA